MMRFRERNQAVLGGMSLLALLLLVVGALNLRKLPLLNNNATYTAEFVNSGGLSASDNVTVAGVRVGSVKDLKLAGTKVRVRFSMDKGIRLGAQTKAYAKVLAVVGTQYLEIDPEGPGKLAGAIPTNRTTVPYTFVDSLQQLSATEQQYDLPTIIESLKVGTEVLGSTSAAETTAALTGLADLSAILAARKAELATVVSEGADLAKTLADRRDQLFSLVGQGDLVLKVLQERRAALQQLFTGTTSLSNELIRLVGPNRTELKSLLTNLQTVSQLLADDTAKIDAALPILGAFNRYAANATGSGQFLDATIPTMLIPDAYIAQCRQPGAKNAATDPSNNDVVGCRP